MAESVVIMTKQANRLDNSLKQKAYTFLEKLETNDETPGLHIEPIRRAVDPRVRTGRVDKQYRAVLFRLDSQGRRYYVLYGIYNHDKANDIAGRTRLSLNPVNGMPDFDTIEQTDPSSTGGERRQGQAPSPAGRMNSPSAGGEVILALSDSPFSPESARVMGAWTLADQREIAFPGSNVDKSIFYLAGPSLMVALDYQSGRITAYTPGRG